MNDHQADAVITALLNAAVVIRDEGPDAVHAAVTDALNTAGDPLAALAVAAALIPVDQPLDRWWLHLRAVPTHQPIPPLPTPDLDDVAIDRRINGERIPLSEDELIEAVRRLMRDGYSAHMAGERLHLSTRTVQRYRAKGRAA